MTHFDDSTAYDRRWTRASIEAQRELSISDPLLFMADHIPTTDRAEGLIAVYAGIGIERSPRMILLREVPEELTFDERLATLSAVVTRLDDVYASPGTDDPGVIALGLVVHRRGGSVVSPSDAMWMRALHALDEMTGVDPVGVIVRTKEGHLVRVHHDAAERAS